jgi:hypothetical protein
LHVQPAQAAQTDFSLTVSGGTPAQWNAGQAYTLNHFIKNNMATARTFRLSTHTDQGHFSNGSSVGSPVAASCVDTVGSRVRDCTFTLQPSQSTTIAYPTIIRACFPNSGTYTATLYEGAIVIASIQLNSMAGGTGRLACSLTWGEQHLTLLNNTSYTDAAYFNIAYPSSHDGMIQHGISSNATIAQIDLAGNHSFMQFFMEPGETFQMYCPWDGQHIYANCTGSPGVNVWMSTTTGFVYTHYHTLGVDGTIKQWIRFFSPVNMEFEQVYFANVS